MSIVFIVSAPSGSGKSTLVRRLMQSDPNLIFSVSYTTRAQRGQEQNGQDYWFVPREEFVERLARGEFLEHAEVFGNYYGTHRGYLDRAEAEGKDLVLDIDVQGARQLMARIPEAVSVFIVAPSRAELAERLRARSEDSEEVIERRLRGAAEEIRRYSAYDYVLVNEDVDTAADTLWSIVKAERVRRDRMDARVHAILGTFER